MPKYTKAYFLHALSPLHVGSGRGVGFIDLPIMREKVTNWPLVPGSSVKGVLADYHDAAEEDRKNCDIKKAAFGLSDDEGQNAGSMNSGSLVFTDARLICLPVRSFYGTFAWVSSPMVLWRLLRDLNLADLHKKLSSLNVQGNKVLIPNDNSNSSVLHDKVNVYLEDLKLYVQPNSNTNLWAGKIAEWCFPDDTSWQNEFKKRFAVIPDNTFDFLCETGTEVNTRIRIEPERKTVKKGALWYEESLPAETILSGLVWCDKVYSNDKNITPKRLMDEFCSKEHELQIGGKATIGKGLARCIFTDGGVS